jgi:hypothetical protein
VVRCSGSECVCSDVGIISQFFEVSLTLQGQSDKLASPFNSDIIPTSEKSVLFFGDLAGIGEGVAETVDDAVGDLVAGDTGQDDGLV